MSSMHRSTAAPADLTLHQEIAQLAQEVAQLRTALQRSEDQWRTTFEQAGVGMAHVSMTGQWLRVNQRLCTMLGYSADEISHKTVQALTYFEDWPREAAAVYQLLTGEIQSHVTNKRYWHKQGHIVWGRLTLSLARTTEGAPDYFVGVLEDSSALRQAEAALHTSEERYRRIVEDQLDLICRFDRDFRLTFVNAAYAATIGKMPAALMGVRITELIPAEYRAQVSNHVTRQNPLGRAATSENPIVLPDGSLRWFEWTDRAIVDEQGAVIEYQAVGRDITARRQAEEAERRQRQFAEALLDSLAALTTSLDVDQVMAQLLASAATVVPSDAGSIVLLENGYARIAYSRGFPPEVTTFFQQNRFAVASLLNMQKALADKAPYIVLDTHLSDDWLAFPLTDWIRASIGVPITRNDEMIGLLVADSAMPHYFQQTDVEKLQAFARYASLALTNAYHATVLEAQVAARTVDLQAAKEQVEAILNHSRDGIALVQSDLLIVKSNPAFCTLFHCCTGDCLGRSFLTLIHPADVAQVQAEFLRFWQQGQAASLEARACRSDGSVFDMELSIGVINEIGLVCSLRDISERKARERQLRYYASLQENVSDAVIATDLDFRIQSWNRAAELIYGWRAEEVLGLSVVDILQTEYTYPEAHTPVVQKLLDQGQWQGEVVQRHKTGSAIDILASITLLVDEQGTRFGAVAINRDMTQRKQAEADLAESRHFAAQVTEAAPNNIYIYDIGQQCNIYSNRNIATLLGYSAEEVKTLGARLLTQLMHPADRARFADHLAALHHVLPDEALVFVYRMQHKDGTWRWLESHDTIFQRNTAGQVSQILGVATDITARKAADERLRAQRDLLQQVIDQVPAFISVKDHTGSYQLVNTRSAEIFGLTAAEMVGRTDADLNPNQAELAFIRQKDQEVLANGMAVFIPEQTIMGNYYQTNKIPLPNEAGVAERLLIVSVDISERKRTEAALQQALQAEKELSALKSGFITTTSHEFRTPLAAILALTETLSAYRHKLSDVQIDERLTKIRQQVEHLRGLMADVLELARIQARRVSFTPVALDPALFCRNLLAEFPSLFGVRHPLLYAGAESLPTVELDQRLLRQILTNLLSNAVKYSPVEHPVTVTLAYTDDLLTLQVQDAGIGIPATDLPHLFQPFQRASNVGVIPGTGLGLTITKEAVELHGGTITATSVVGVGTTMTVRIPATRAQRALSAAH